MKKLFGLLILVMIFSLSDLAVAEPQNSSIEPANLFVIKLKNGAFIQISETPSDLEALESFNQLTSEERQLFLERRQDLISSVVQYMTFPKTLGGMKWFKNQIIKVREVTNYTGSLINWVGRHLKLSKTNEPTDNFLEPTKPGETVKVAPTTITELGLQALSEIIQIMDHELWKDAPLIAKSQKSGWTFYLGGSAGIAIGKSGFYKLGALELDIDYDFVKNEKEINIYYGKQNFKKSIFVFELHMVFGALRRYATSEPEESIKAEVTALPMVIGYRRSSQQIALGLVSGISLIDTAATVLIATGYPEAGAAILSVAKPLHSFSMFWTELGRKKLYSKTLKQPQTQSFRKFRCQALFSR